MMIDLNRIAQQNATALTREMLDENAQQAQTAWVALMGIPLKFFKKHTPNGNGINNQRFAWLLRNEQGSAWVMNRNPRSVDDLESATTIQTLRIAPQSGPGDEYHVKIVDGDVLCLFDPIKFVAYDLIRAPHFDLDFKAVEAERIARLQAGRIAAQQNRTVTPGPRTRNTAPATTVVRPTGQGSASQLTALAAGGTPAPAVVQVRPRMTH